MNDFWLSCGHHLLDRNARGRLVVTDEFLKVYLARPELVPPQDACAAERNLYAALLADPRRPVAAAEIAAIADIDARENWQFLVAFRDRLLRHPTLEATYAALVRDGARGVPTLFISQLVHVILRNALDGESDARALERWIGHVAGVTVDIEPLKEMRDVDLAWYVGLDAEGTRIGDRVLNGETLDQAAMVRIVALFRLTFRDSAAAREDERGEPVYLILAMTPEKIIRMKLQNLVTGLPVRHLEAVT